MIFFTTLIANWEIVISFFIIAILYSSVGFGGGSSYLAVLGFFGLPFVEIRAISLICNITVVSTNVLRFIKNKAYNWKKIMPLVLVSIPMAFIGGKLKINSQNFMIFLAIILIIAAFFMLVGKYVKESRETRKNSFKDFIFGGSVGFISGLVGIGGGIFLAPLLHITKWDTPKKIAAASSIFILVNSFFGLLGQAQNPQFHFEPYLTSILVLTVFLGGQIGSRMREKLISPKLLKIMTAILILFVAVKLIVEKFI